MKQEATWKAFIAEDLTFGPKGLYVDLLPSSGWGFDPSINFSRGDWLRFCGHLFTRAERRCEACGAERVHLESHERWGYNGEEKVMRLERFAALCNPCHQVTHFGKLRIDRPEDGKEWGLARLGEVNGWTPQAAEKHLSQAFALWRGRSKISWNLDWNGFGA